MNRAQFTTLVEHTLEDVIVLAEEYAGKALRRKFAFQWLGHNELIREAIVDAIVNKVYVDDDHVYPCVDIGVGGLLEDGTPIIVASIAGYSPRPFQKNWTGRDGPFVQIIGNSLINKLIVKKVEADRPFSYIIPDMKRSRE